jgi:hypothetical protein
MARTDARQPYEDWKDQIELFFDPERPCMGKCIQLGRDGEIISTALDQPQIGGTK